MIDVSQQLIQDRIRDLRENTDFVSTLFESLTGYAIIAADFDGNVIAYNEGAREIYDHAPEEIVGKQNMEIFFPEESIETGQLQQIIGGLIGEERFSYEGEKVRKSGDRFPAQILFTLTRDRSGKVAGLIEIVADLTERKRAEEAEVEARANAERIEQLERELTVLERVTPAPPTSVTAEAFGLPPLRQGMPDTFDKLVERYGDLIDLALERRAYKVEHNISEGLRSMGQEIGFLKGRPRDVVEIHSTALKRKSNGAAPQRAQAYVEEGRLMVLEVMGYLASYYRDYSISTRDITKREEGHG